MDYGTKLKTEGRNKITIIYFGPWNAWNLLKPGKMQELAGNIANTQLQIDAIQETRWSGNI